MEVLMSNWADVQTLPESYVFPPDRRPGKRVFPVYEDIPIIDLQKPPRAERPQLIQQILKASQDFGFFQVINHGVSEDLVENTMEVYKEFFNMPAEDKARLYSNDINKSCRLYSSTMNYENEDFHYWRDNFTHRCHPLLDHIHSWPHHKPLRYREIVGEYCVELRKFLFRILDLIGEGLGVEEGYFEEELSKIQLLSVNHHITCPDPSLTIGMPEHSDPNLISMLHQCHVPGLQVFKDGEWLGIEPIPNAFLVIPGLQLKEPNTPSDTHSKEARTTIGTFLIPTNDILIEAAYALVNNPGNSQVYKSFTYKEFFTTFTGSNFNAEKTLEFFKNGSGN